MKLWNGMLVAVMLAMMMAAAPVAAADDPSGTIDALETALMAKDPDGAVALFTDDATARRTPPLPNTTGMYRGKAEIRTFWQALIALNPRFETLGQRQVAGEQVTWTSNTGLDVWRQLGIPSLMTRGEATVRGGRIVAIAIIIPPESLARVQAAMAAPATVVQRFIEARNRYDVAGTLALITDDIRVVGGPRCSQANPCLGAATFRMNLENSYIVNHVQLIIVGTPQASGTTVRLRTEARADIYRPAGVERIITDGTFEVRDGKVAIYIDVPDASDAQTAQFLAYQRAQQGPPATPTAPPRTGGGSESTFIRRLGDG